MTSTFKAFLAWAGSKGYDCAHTYDTDRSKWLALNPMTADLWAVWQGAQAAPSTSLDAQDAARYRWLRSTTNFVTNSTGGRIDVRNFPLAWDEAIDAAIKGGE